MMRTAVLAVLLSLLVVAAANAQQLDIFDPDDFVDPWDLPGPVFISRLVAGASRGYLDQYRPVGQDVGFVHIANSLYWSGFQFDYKRTQLRGENPPPEESCRGLSVQASACMSARIELGAAPVPGSKDLAQLSWYQTIGNRVTIRYRIAQGRQSARPETAAHVPGIEDHDDTRILQVDGRVFVGNRVLSGTVAWTELTRHSTFDQTKQRTLIFGTYLPIVLIGPAQLISRLQLGSVSGVTPVIDIINPSVELALHVERVNMNLHVVYSPVFRDLGNGKSMNHQVAVYADRRLFMFIFGRKKGGS
jgi:hypothetical protein